MSDDLATQSLGPTKLTLAERRQLHADWLASGGRIPSSTGMPHSRVDDVEPTKAHVPPAVGTLNELPPGAVVRTDEGSDTPDPSEEVRLKLAGALASKMEGVDAETATRMANAGNALLTPLKVRADDDADVKNRVLEPKKALDEDGEEKPRKATDNEEEDKKEPTLGDVIKALGVLHKRMEKLETKRNDNGEEEETEDDSGSEDNPDRGPPRGPGEGTPELAADDAEYGSDALRSRTRVERMDKEIHNWKNQDRFAAFQARADQISQLFGKSASPPIAGETLGAYKRRTVREWQKFSPAFKNSDLRVLQVADGVAFNVAIEDILARADKEGRNPSQIPAGYLAERSEVRGGHTFTKFYGRPSTWMNQFAHTGKRVRRIIERGDSGISRTLYEHP